MVEGINLITLLWTEGDRHVPMDDRLYDKANGARSKNDHFRAMLSTACTRGFQPAGVIFDSGYSSLENLKLIDSFGWVWLTRLKANRLVNPERRGQHPVAQLSTGPQGCLVYLKGYGLMRWFVIEIPDGEREYWATNDLEMRSLTRTRLSGYAWTIEHYHRGIKQCCGVECAQVRAARAQRNPISLALRAFLRLESYCYHRGIRGFEAKHAIIREAVRAYLREPIYQLIPTASLL